MERDRLLGEGSSDSEGKAASGSTMSDERAVPDKHAMEADAERPEPLCKSKPGMLLCVYVFVCVCVCVCVLHAVTVHNNWFATGNRRSVAGNFDALTSTLREAKMNELELEE